MIIDNFNKSNAFSVKSEKGFNPLSEDLKSKISKLESHVRDLESKNHALSVEITSPSDPVNLLGPKYESTF